MTTRDSSVTLAVRLTVPFDSPFDSPRLAQGMPAEGQRAVALAFRSPFTSRKRGRPPDADSRHRERHPDPARDLLPVPRHRIFLSDALTS